jgi:hypothetical protein
MTIKEIKPIRRPLYYSDGFFGCAMVKMNQKTADGEELYEVVGVRFLKYEDIFSYGPRPYKEKPFKDSIHCLWKEATDEQKDHVVYWNYKRIKELGVSI